MLQKYVRKNTELLRLRDRFDAEPKAVFENQLQPFRNFTPEEQHIAEHNNFGICDQVLLKAKDEGLTRITATYDGPEKMIESSKAEVATYSKLTCQKPDYEQFLSSLYSTTQSGQEYATFEGMIPTGHGFKKKHFVLVYGSKFDLELTGGANFWKEFIEEYDTTFEVQATIENILDVKITEASAVNTRISIGCGMPPDGEKSYEYVVLITAKGKVNKHLLRPRIHQEMVRVNCEAPS